MPDKSNMALVIYANGIITYSDGTSISLSKNAYGQYSEGVMASGIDKFTQSINKKFGYIKATMAENGITVTASSSAK